MEISNKKLGTNFEQEFVRLLSFKGFWAHFIQPDKRGAQPFDVIAIRYGEPWVFDCKTCISHIFSLKRMEINQMLAFEKVRNCGCRNIFVAISHEDNVYLVRYSELLEHGSVQLDESHLFKQVIC